jgi:hypothetical protein
MGLIIKHAVHTSSAELSDGGRCPSSHILLKGHQVLAADIAVALASFIA